MSGFLKATFIAEHYGNFIVNSLYYRSAAWLPFQGNPFTDTSAMLSVIWSAFGTVWKNCHNQDTRCLRLEGVGYDDQYRIVTSSPLIRTVDEAGAIGSLPCMGSYQSANIGLRCGEQHQIYGLGESKRNRGYLSIGPMTEDSVDNYGHLTGGWDTHLENFAKVCDDELTVVTPAVTLIPIRMHEKWQRFPAPIPDVLLFRTYSDVLGYTIPRKASVRKSRMGEA
jgi:hypothetical protein